MAEQDQQKKKARLVWRIFKWIGLGLLALLLIAGIIFQAPWKVITLLVVILAACTVLPKPVRKWFWLSAGVVVIALIIWVLLPEDNEDWRPYTFDEELAAMKAEYAIPDEENAAVIYNELFETLDVDSNQPKFFWRTTPSSLHEPWLTKDHPETAEWLKGHQSTIDKLIQATKKEKCRFFPICVEPVTYGNYLNRLPKIRNSERLLISFANNDVAEDRNGDAIEKYSCVIQIADHMFQQPAMMYYLVGFAIENLSMQMLNRFVIESRPTAEQLQLISSFIKSLENNWGTDWRKMLDFEKLFAKNSLCCMVYEINPNGKIRRSRGLPPTAQEFKEKAPSETYRRRRCAKLGTIFVGLYYPSSPVKVIEIINTGFEKYFAMAEPDYDWSKEPDYVWRLSKFNYRAGVKFLAGINEPTYYRVHEIYLTNLALRRGSRLLVAIKQYNIEHGSWPSSLDKIKSGAPAEAFIDPVGGGQFEYENHGERFSLFGETINIWPK